MRRSASEIIRNLESRIARLEKQSRIDPRTYRLASTRKVAGQIVLAGAVNVRQLRRDLEDTFGIEDIEIDDGVLTFLMSNLDNTKVVKQVESLAKKHDVKFEKGEFTDGLGMIYTKQASRRNRRASNPMFTVTVYEETTTWVDEEDPDGYEQETDTLVEEEVYSFEDLLEELESNSNIRYNSWGEWSSSRPEVNGRRSDWITSYEEQDMRSGDSTRVSLHFNPARGVDLDKGQIRQIEKVLGM